MQYSIDINADLGEGIGNEAQLIPLISSCNIACGGHAGNITTMRETIKLAKLHNVKIGAHPSFPDIENFGRKPLEMSPAELSNSIQNQIENLIDILNSENAKLHHIKPHGVLYNLAAKDENTASVILDVIKRMELPPSLYVPYKSVIADMAIKNTIPIVYEAFADRNYNDDLSLVSRHQENAVMYNEDEVFEHVFRIISKRKVKTVTNNVIGIKAETICIHGDNPKAINLASSLRQALELKGIRIT